MNNFNPKVGYKIYCPKVSNEILTIQGRQNGNYPLFAVSGQHKYDFTADGKYYVGDSNPSIFPATQEWYEKLVQIYPDLEAPPKRKNPEEVIQAMLDDGWRVVPVSYLDGEVVLEG